MQELDRKLLQFFNRDLANAGFDVFFPFWTDFQKSPVFYLLMLIILGFLIFKKNWRALFVVTVCAFGMYLSDVLNSQLIKPLFERPRPVDTILRTAAQGSFSFPSSHAVDVFFMAAFISFFYPRFKTPLFILAFLTSFSRVYCGVHYPGDILGGAVVGFILAFIIYKITDTLMKSKMKFLFLSFTLLFSFQGLTMEDPTGGKPFFPWVWNDQLKPTIVKGFDKTGLIITGSTAVAALAVHQYDGKIYDFSEDGGNLWVSEDTAGRLGKLGNGVAGLLIVGTQFYFDQPNGLKTARAVLLTTVAHLALAATIRRNRPGNKQDFLPFPSAFPSGHTSSAFALAGSMAYSYGWAGAIPGYLVASAIGLSRIKENRHWASDVVGGAILGTFWARASFTVDENEDKEAFFVLPIPVDDGGMLSATKTF